MKPAFFGLQKPSKATHNEWLDMTRTTFRKRKNRVAIDSELSALDALYRQ
uniref:Transposase n=1 Tax=Heterorhabditis bacteriophora TaxID=37862 RepID=A0A1I7XP41_HETBA